MPNVLILGATGYLGLAVANELIRSGNYHVWGHTRSVAKAKLLEQNEIIPATGDITDPFVLIGIISSCRIHVVVDATSTVDEEARKIMEAVLRVRKFQQAVLTEMETSGPKLGYVYVSRAGVHALPNLPTFSKAHSDDSVQLQTIKAAPRRPDIENTILLARSILDVAIVRPHLIYGYASPILGQLWKNLVDADSRSTTPIEIPAEASLHAGVVHLEDVTTAFHIVIDRIHGQLSSWPVFDLWTESVRVENMMEAAKMVLGLNMPLTYVSNANYRAFDTWVLENISGVSTAKSVLGWSPKRVNLLADMRIYLRAYIAAQSEEIRGE